MSKIVISYRRRDSEAISGRIRDLLAAEHGPDSVFMDIDSIPIGVNFREYIATALGHTDVLLVVIGPHWLGDQEHNGRIQNASDPVRIELEKAFEFRIPICPVLVNGATMPDQNNLPETLQKLSDLNAAIVDAGQDFHVHMDRLIRQLNLYLTESGKKTNSATRSTKAQPNSFQASVARTAELGSTPELTFPSKKVIRPISISLIVAAAFGIWLLYDKHYRPPLPTETIPPAASTATTNIIDAIGCDEEKNLRSLSAATETTISFTNDSSNVKRIYWLNYTGNRELYATLATGKSISLPTYITHPYGSDQCEAIYMPSRSRQGVSIAK